MAGDFYVKKEYWDATDDVTSVAIHYTTALFGQAPDWNLRETRPMVANETLRSGVGGFSRYGPAAPYRKTAETPNLGGVDETDDIRGGMGLEGLQELAKFVQQGGALITEGSTSTLMAEYNLHSFYEVVRGGQISYSPVLVDEIRTRDILYVTPDRRISGACAYWSIGDWDAPQFNPTEELRFLAKFGEDHPLHQFKFYGAEDKDGWNAAKTAILNANFSYPRRFWTRLAAPVGAQVNLMFHTGTDWDRPEHERWEAYILDETFTMEAGLEPFFAAFGYR